MTMLVRHVSTPEHSDDIPSLGECLKKDHDHAQRPLRFPNPFLKKKRIEWFNVRDVNMKRPDKLNERGNRAIHDSAICLPATTESLRKIKRAFEMYGGICIFNDLEIVYPDGIAVITFSILTPIKPKER